MSETGIEGDQDTDSTWTKLDWFFIACLIIFGLLIFGSACNG